MIILENETNTTINLNKLEKIVNILNIKKDIELLIVSNKKIQQINNEFRNINKPTDVLSFPLKDLPNAPLGSIIISIDKAKSAALSYNHSIEEEVTLLFIHGILHLLGYDHEEDNGEMRQKEEELIKLLNLPKSLIVRTI